MRLGEVGEIAVKGPTVFSGYVIYGNFAPGGTEAFTPDGYYRSGDLGYLDAAGDVHIIGRRKDMINVGGENVFAWEVEQIIVQLQDVKECAAFSVPHEVLGEVVEVAIVRSGEQVTGAKVKERCRQSWRISRLYTAFISWMSFRGLRPARCENSCWRSKSRQPLCMKRPRWRQFHRPWRRSRSWKRSHRSSRLTWRR